MIVVATFFMTSFQLEIFHSSPLKIAFLWWWHEPISWYSIFFHEQCWRIFSSAFNLTQFMHRSIWNFDCVYFVLFFCLFVVFQQFPSCCYVASTQAFRTKSPHFNIIAAILFVLTIFEVLQFTRQWNWKRNWTNEMCIFFPFCTKFMSVVFAFNWSTHFVCSWFLMDAKSSMAKNFESR